MTHYGLGIRMLYSQPMIWPQPDPNLDAQDVCYSQLRDWITHGTLAPDEMLDLQQLQIKLGATPQVLQTALQRLANEQLVQQTANAWQVARVERALAARIYPILQLLEPLALELALPHMGAGEWRSMRHLNGQVETALRNNDGKTAALYDAALHDIFIERCNNFELMQILRTLKISHIRLAITYWHIGEFAIESIEEHHGIIAALEQHDLAGAKALLASNWARPLARFAAQP
jgi:DNA-binding GntR family transcriptional regulator